MADTKTVRVSILDKDYQVSCEASEVAALQRSANFLDQKMREMKESSNVIGLDRLAVMAALNLTNELLAQSDQTTQLNTKQSETADENRQVVKDFGFQGPYVLDTDKAIARALGANSIAPTKR